MQQKTTPDIFLSKPHFEVLDGLRGVAALAIVIFHFTEFIFADYSKNFIGHGFLAVDFFFCLSGFVIAYAYDNRIATMGIWEFFKSRLIRLHPLVILGSILGLLGFMLDPFNTYTNLYSAGKITLIFISSVFLIPFPVMAERGFGLFSFNSPSWSLFFEYVANIFYALVVCKITRNYLMLLTCIAAAALCFVGYHTGTLIGGWGGGNFLDGFARVAFSFLAGIIVYRSNWIIKNKLGIFILTILLLLTFVMPYFKWNGLAELIVVIFIYPLIVALGAGTVIAEGLKSICSFLGRLSYPLYMTHIAGVWVFGNYYGNHRPVGIHLWLIVAFTTVLLVLLAYAVMVYFDTPVRKYLTERRKAAYN